MYTMLKKIVTEKDVNRQIQIAEQLLNHSKLTVKEISEETHTTERTIFSDLNVIREHLPSEWELVTDNSGIQLVSHGNSLTNDIWETFFQHSITLQVIKELLFTKELNAAIFLHEAGVSFETLRRHINKVNVQLKDYNIYISLRKSKIQFIGAESAIRIFYHRLLLPFTHNNYFFEDYTFHEVHYFDFLSKRIASELMVETEQIFGICWFFINSIRIKAGCKINHFFFDDADPLFLQYAPLLNKLYAQEGIYLTGEEAFFAFFCFLESWNYNNHFGEKLMVILHEDYTFLLKKTQQIVTEIADELHLPKLLDTKLRENLLILLLKYKESPLLSEQFQLEYQDLLINPDDEQQAFLQAKGNILFNSLRDFTDQANTMYLENIFLLVCQQAILSVDSHTMTVYLLFQGEPAWKAFLQQELADFLGKRVKLVPIEFIEAKQLTKKDHDLLVSNVPLDEVALPVIYLSTIPTKNELSQLTEFTSRLYIQ